MRSLLVLAISLSAAAQSAAGQDANLLEQLVYSVNYPSGLPLGSATLETREVPFPDGSTGREFVFELQAAVPGFEVKDRYRSRTTPGYCSLEFEKNARHGKKAAKEVLSFHPQAGEAVRQTLDGGGQSRFPVPDCAKDALAYLQYFRREMASGRVPPPATIYFGAAYQLRLEYAGRQRVSVGSETLDADRVQVLVKGPASEHSFQVYLAVEPERRPVLFRVTLPQGLFTMELADQQ